MPWSLFRICGRGEGRSTPDPSEFLNYLTLALELSPTLEHAVDFAASQSEGKLGEELRREVIKQRLSLERFEVLRNFASGWEESFSEVGRAVQLIESSVHERDEVNRRRTLDRAIELILDGARSRAREFAARIHLPIILIYGVGILVPLVLVALLPTWSVIGGGAGLELVVALYCILLPLAVFLLSGSIARHRPGIIHPPEVRIPKPSAKEVLIPGSIFALALAIASLRFQPLVCGFLLLWSAVISSSLFLYTTTRRPFALRKDVGEMERELPDALMQLGGYMGEGRPVEEVFEKTANNLRGSKLGKAFAQVVSNIRVGGMGVRSALFSDNHGSFARIPSRAIRGTMLMLAGLVQRSTEAAGRAILRISSHLKRLEEVKREIRVSLGEMVSSMRSVAVFFAPLVTAITARIQGMLATRGGELLSSSMDPAGLTLVMGVYSVILSVLLVNLVVELEHGNDQVIKRMSFAICMPLALGIFSVGWLLAGSLLGFLTG
jgi:hypothetical protein